MSSLKLLGPAEVNLCRTSLYSPSCLCRADELWEAASALVLCMIRGETTLPLWSQMKNLLLVFSPLLLFHCELNARLSSKEQISERKMTCKLQLDLVIFHKRLLCLNERWQRTGAERWQRGNNEMPLSLWSFPGGYCVFQVIIVVRTVRSTREGMAAFEGNGYCGWWRERSPWSCVAQCEERDNRNYVLFTENTT